MSDDRIPPLVLVLLRGLLPPEEREFFLGDAVEDRRRRRAAGEVGPFWLREILGALTLRLRVGAKAGGSGGKTGVRDRSGKGDGMSRELLHDLRFGARMMLRSPGFTAVALLTMALGIGANTAMFSIVNGVVFRPLPYPEVDRIVLIQENNMDRGWPTFSVAPLNYWDWEERNRSTELLAAYRTNTANLTGLDRPQSVRVYRATAAFLPILGGIPRVGRGIMEEDLDPDAEAVVVLTHGFWERVLGGDPNALGGTLVVDDVPRTVVGILPEEWRPLTRSALDLIIPLTPEPNWYLYRGSHFLQGIGRLAPDVSLEQARADFSSIASALEEAHPDTNGGWGVTIRPLEQVILGSARQQLFIFMASVGLVLLIACANLANMTLARATVRGRELAIRTAIGASRRRVLRQLLAESVLLATVGGAMGVAMAWAGLRAFVAGWPAMLPRMEEIGIDAAVLLFSLALAVGSGVLSGLLPATSLAKDDLQDALRHGSRSVAGDRSRRWMRSGLVMGEVGLAVVLLVGTGLLVRSFAALAAEDPGFETADRLVLTTPLPRARYPESEDRRRFGQEALARIGAVPGVASVALTSLIPLAGSDQIWGYWLEANASLGTPEDGSTLFYRISPGYFETFGIPILAGRGVTADDAEDGPQVVVISASLAERHFPDQNPLGRLIKFGTGDDDLPVEIVGVVGDVQHYTLGQSRLPQVYVPFEQRPSGFVNWVVEASGPALMVVDGIREAIEAIDPDQPLVGVQTADDLISSAVSMPRFRTFLMAGFGFTALVLAVVGLYGIMAYTVSLRRKEIGVRMALGATRTSVLGLILREGGPVVGAGLGIGLLGALALSRILESMLFGVGARDPGVFAAVPILLALVATLAMLAPARRASRVDPVQTLGEE